jgi:hypothetical protein
MPLKPGVYAVVGRYHYPLSYHDTLDAAITASVSAREIARAKGASEHGGVHVHNTDAYDLGCPDGLTDAERKCMYDVWDEAGVL